MTFCALSSAKGMDIKMWVLLKDFLLVSMGMGIGVVLMCILNVGKEADYEMK